MSENVLELHELDELKATYNLMDERLDGQQIVSDEQLHEATVRKFTDMRQNAKEALIWVNIIFVPVILLDSWLRSRLTVLGLILMGIYWVGSVILRFVVLRRTKKADYGSYDLKTLVEKESRYSKNIMWGNIATLLFFLAYLMQELWVDGTRALMFFLILVLIMLVGVFSRKLVIKYKYNGQAIDPATGKPRVLKSSKWMQIVGYSFLGLAGCVWLVGVAMSLTSATGLYGLLHTISYVPSIMAFATLVLGILHQKRKITVSRTLLIVLSVIAFAIGLSVTGVALLKGFTDLTSSSGLVMVVCVSMLSLSLHKARKE